MPRPIYLDTSSTTQVNPAVLAAMQPYFREKFGNPGSMHNFGFAANEALDSSRRKISEILNCNLEEIIFTGSGTESINLALKGFAQKNKDKGNHIISTTIEHHAVLDTLDYLEDQGFKVTYIPVGESGIVSPDKIREAITDQTILISVMYANNEIGTIQPIRDISQIANEHGISLHTDACQAGNSESLDVQGLGVDLMSINGSKLYGPKGVGVLYKKKKLKLEALIHGGGQEFRLRSGTENVPGIVGLATALEIAQMEKEEYTKKLTPLRDYFIEGLLKIDNTLLNGDANNRLPNNVNVTFLNVEGESILLMLNEKGIYASSGSACTSKSLDPSHVILALGRPYEVAHGSIRFTLSKDTTKEDIDYVLNEMPPIIERLRGMSPVVLKKEDL
jgi:cysteine desulfurase